MNNELFITIFIVSLLLTGGGMLLAHILAPSSSHSPIKFEPYECGIVARGEAWSQFNVGYYLFALVYLVFEVETIFLFPWGVVMREVGIRAFIEIVIFFFILGLGWLYAWKKGALKWQ